MFATGAAGGADSDHLNAVGAATRAVRPADISDRDPDAGAEEFVRSTDGGSSAGVGGSTTTGAGEVLAAEPLGNSGEPGNSGELGAPGSVGRSGALGNDALGSAAAPGSGVDRSGTRGIAVRAGGAVWVGEVMSGPSGGSASSNLATFGTPGIPGATRVCPLGAAGVCSPGDWSATGGLGSADTDSGGSVDGTSETGGTETGAAETGGAGGTVGSGSAGLPGILAVRADDGTGVGSSVEPDESLARMSPVSGCGVRTATVASRDPISGDSSSRPTTLNTITYRLLARPPPGIPECAAHLPRCRRFRRNSLRRARTPRS
jgi:hypothetical protein